VGEGAGCAEPPAPYLFRASGNEPFWSVTVGMDSVVLEQPEDPRRVAAPVTRREEGTGRRVFHAATSGPSAHSIQVALTPGRCADSMSGALYSFSAEVSFDGRALSGCARAGDLGEAP
jgi:putative lipoprotein